MQRFLVFVSFFVHKDYLFVDLIFCIFIKNKFLLLWSVFLCFLHLLC